MIEKLISFSLNQRTLIVMILFPLTVLGIYSFVRMPIDAFPDVTNIQVEVVSTAPGLSPLEIEKFVTYPIEMSMKGLPGLVTMRSVTKFGISVVTLVFRDDVEIYFARQLVFQRLAEAEKLFPEGAEAQMGPVATAMGEIYQYTLEGIEPTTEAGQVENLTNLRTLQDWVIVPLLKSVPGVNEVNSFGGYIKQFQVVVSPEKLVKYDLSLAAVAEAISSNNKNVGGGIADHNSEQFIIRGIGLVRSADDLEDIVLKSRSGIPVFIKDVADVVVGQAVRQGASLKDGRKEVVGGIVMMLRGENSHDVVTAVEEKVGEINGSNILPHGLRIVPYYNRSEIVEKSIDTVLKALAIGAILVILILYLFLRTFRGAVVVIMALPLSAFLTFIVMKNANLNANLMSLGGLAICIGMIIDATIIQVENVQRHLSLENHSGSKIQAVLRAVIEVRKPSIFGELIIALTFVPIVSLQGQEGKMFSPLAFTVAIALFSSLLLSIFVIPVLCSLILKPGSEKQSPLLRGAKAAYLPLLRWGLKNKWVILCTALLLLAASILTIPRLGREFIPIMDEGAFDMDIQLLPGISLQKAMETSKLVEQKLMQFPELETIVSRTGQTGIAVEARGVDKTGYVGALKPRSAWTSAQTREELMNKMRESVAGIPGMAVTFSQPIQCRIDELMAGTRAQLILKLFGEDTGVLQAKANEMAEVLSQIRGATDLIVEQVSGQPYITVQVDRAKMARYGINVDNLLKIIEVAVGGRPVSQVYEENRFFDVVAKFPEEKRNSVEAIGNILVNSPHGYNLPLAELASIAVTEGPVQISRENGERRMGIELNVKGRDMGGFVEEAQKKIRAKIALPSGYHLSWGGQFENQQRAMRRLMVIAPLVVLLIFSLLLFTFNSAKLASLVIFNLPFALIGGVFALYISGLYLSVPASIGFIVLFGVAVLNGVVLVSYISQLRQEGRTVHDAILRGCEVRLRPVLMTASIAVFSLIPMLFATGPGSEVQRPLAVVVVGGLITSTLLTLLVLPILYGLFEKKR